MARIFGKYALHCNGEDPFVTLIRNLNWGPMSRNNIVFRDSNETPDVSFLAAEGPSLLV